jgi:aminobenzoyl-glutamate utilization protein B
MQNAHSVWTYVDARRQDFEALSDRVWATPETCYMEVRSTAEHVAELERQGFRVTKDVAGIPTAVMGEAGDEGPVIAILGEYDALPGLSQEAGVAEHRPVEANGNGHGCGHNLLGAGAMLAATAVKDWLAATGIKARVRYYGCPAEEGGAGKTFMVKAGAFDDVDLAFCWHPECFAEVTQASSLANSRCDFTFTGRASHAAGSPHLGRSALDAVELMNVGVNYMREHMPSDCRVHYAMIDGGGIAPNVVQASAKVRYSIRSPNLPGMRDLVARVHRIAQGAAMMTDTRVEMTVLSAVSNLLGNKPLEDLMWKNLARLGPPEFDDADRAFAREIQKTLSDDDIADAYARFGLGEPQDKALCDIVVSPDIVRPAMMGSTDVADVSWVVPLVQMNGATCAIGTPFHSWQLTAQGKSPAAKKGMVHVAKVIAATAADALLDPGFIPAAKADLARRTAKTPYVCPIPDGVQPPVAAMSSKGAA